MDLSNILHTGKICLSNILHTGRLSVFVVALSSCSTMVFHPCSAMGRGKQWSADTVLQVKTLMSIGLPLPRIADIAQRQCPLEKGLYLRQAKQSPWWAREADEMRRWVSDYLLARPRASVSEVPIEFQKCGSDLSRSTLHNRVPSHWTQSSHTHTSS